MSSMTTTEQPQEAAMTTTTSDHDDLYDEAGVDVDYDQATIDQARD